MIPFHHESPADKEKSFTYSRLALPFLGLIVGFLAAFVYLAMRPSKPVAKLQITNTSTPTPSPTPGPQPISVLLLGYGGPTHDGGYLTDTLIQVIIQPALKRTLMITIPRDLAVSIPVSATETIDDKINAAFAIGIDDKKYPEKADEFKATTNPGALSKKLISEITGYPIDAYVALSFDGFVKAIDALGGIEVVFPQSFDDYRYPIRGKENNLCGFTENDVATLSATFSGDELESQFSCRYEHLHVSKGKQILTGEEALKVARSRHSLETRGDFSRSERQKLILQAAKERVFEIGFLPKAIPFFLSLGRDLKTDMDVSTLRSLLPYAQEMRTYDLISIALSDENVLDQGYNARGQYVLTPRNGVNSWISIQEFIAKESSQSGKL